MSIDAAACGGATAVRVVSLTKVESVATPSRVSLAPDLNAVPVIRIGVARSGRPVFGVRAKTASTTGDGGGGLPPDGCVDGCEPQPRLTPTRATTPVRMARAAKR